VNDHALHSSQTGDESRTSPFACAGRKPISGRRRGAIEKGRKIDAIGDIRMNARRFFPKCDGARGQL
jgi:hypothetical protein